MESGLKILVTEPSGYSEKALKLLSEKGTLSFGPVSREELLEMIPNTDVVVLRLAHVFDQEILKAAKNLKFILTPTTGLNHIDVESAEKQSIQIISLKGETAFLKSIPSTAEHTWALMLALLRKIPQAHQHVMENQWNRDIFKGHNLNALQLGILGYGRVGQQIAKFAKAFNMQFCYYDIDPAKSGENSVSSLEELLRQSDILSIHIPLNPENVNFLNSENLNEIKDGAYIVNTSRGEVIDEKNLVQLLKRGKLRGCATDVLTGELNKAEREKSPLLKYAQRHENVIITPHIAGATMESMHLTEEFVMDKFLSLYNSIQRR